MKRVFRVLLKCCVWFVVLTVLWVVIYRYVPVYYTPLMAIRSFENTEKNSKFKHEWVSIEDISKQTLPEDFQRNPKIHHCWSLVNQ